MQPKLREGLRGLIDAVALPIVPDAKANQDAA
jgi:hypothetical protein